MFKTGLKLWSINTGCYFEEAKRLFDSNVFDYIELYVVPDTISTMGKWKSLNIPINIHCPHFAHNFNLAQKSFEETNLKIYHEVKDFADELEAEFIVFHGGLDGTIKETARQLASFNESRALIENKPFRALANKMKGEFCRGSVPEEVEYVMRNTGCGFCLDIGHAICSANTQKLEPYSFVKKFNDLNPASYHLSDNLIDSELDKHMHIGDGNYNIKKILNMLNDNKYLALETNKNSKENLHDFVKDTVCLKTFIQN